MKQQIISLLEGKKKETEKEFNIGSEYSTPRIIRANGFNQGIDTAIESVPEILEIISSWAKKRCEDNIIINGTDKWNSDLEDLINKLKE